MNQLLEILTSTKSICLVCHASPDADTLGSAVALQLALKQIDKQADIFITDPVPAHLKFLGQLTDIQSIKQIINIDQYETLIFVDCSKYQVSGLSLNKTTNKNTTIINIDHHQNNSNFGHINIVKTNYSSTTHIIFTILQKLNFKFDAKIATAILAGIYYDTGSFMHSNTSTAILKIAGELLTLGAKLKDIQQNLYQQKSVKYLKTLSQVFKNATINKKQILSSTINSEHKTEFDEAISYLNSVPNKKISLLLKQTKNGIKCSLRTQSDKYDLNKIANIFGGGGHKMASGFFIKASQEDVKAKS